MIDYRGLREEAFDANMKLFELQFAKIAWLTKSINPQAPKLKQSLINKHFQRKHGRDAYYGQKKDK